MEKQAKLKSKLSFSPNRTLENVFTMRARFGKKPRHNQQNPLSHPISQNHSPFSQSVHKSKTIGSKLFSGAHRIDSKQTYLLNEKAHKESKTKESSTPKSPHFKELKSHSGAPLFKILRRKSNENVNGNEHGSKDIQRTVEIAIKGRKEDMPTKERLMTTLSNLILGGEKSQDDFFLQILGESSIHGEQQNFIQLDSFQFNEGEFTFTNEEKQ